MSGPPLVTGATGFAGSHLVEHLLAGGGDVAAWAHAGGRTARDDAGGRIRWGAVDLLDAASVTAALDAVRPSAVYHCAGVAHVGASWSEPVRALEVNVLGTHHLLEGLRRAGLHCPVLVTGSALVYRQSAGPIDEGHPIGPASPYAVSKLAQEMLAARTTGAPIYVARPFNHAGPRQDASFVTSSFARQIAEIECGRREPVMRVGNLETRRDITDVRDVVRGYSLILAHGEAQRPYNICRGQAYLVSDLLHTLVGMSSLRIAIEQDPARLRPNDNPVVLGDPSRLVAETGWSPAFPIDTTLRDLLDYWRSRLRQEEGRR